MAKKVKKHKVVVKVSREAIQKKIDKKTAEIAKLTLQLADQAVEVAIVADPQAP